ncbi:phospho-sugar mutase [Schaalia vaccimaxillae]|uniref:phospho-sugar mutase n=1 Tax=Schaalia vaccimaxillae TaxID=183916 RepID=UPI0003B64C05|nr:phospho-sugar mutase [Schaalia vaccimaxillae]
MAAALTEQARLWAEHDPDPATKNLLLTTIKKAEDGDRAAADELEAAMAGPLEFGTAGLRGAMGPGESRMNLAVVIRATAGLAAYLKEAAGRHPQVIVGCDARHSSAQFAQAAAGVLSAAGCRPLMLPLAQPTPLVAFSMRHFDADAGIMITASHNPAQDNGYKVYLGGTVVTDSGQGVQIVPPHDALIAGHIAAAPPADQIPLSDDLIEQVDPTEAYVARALALAPNSAGKDNLNITVTPMHGVGGALVTRVLRETGFSNVSLVAQQAEPDPDFPTVAFPNPEEPGALDLAMAHASQQGSDLIIAVDPDADRCALVIPDPDEDSAWRQLSGDEFGAILGEYVASNAPKGAVLANSIVSSRLLERIAIGHGLGYRHTLTGFKWIARTPGLHFGYEEAIGYCCDPPYTRDKDGITAALLAATLFAQLKAEGSSGVSELERIARTYGLYATSPLTFRVNNPEQIAQGMRRLRSQPPTSLAGSPVSTVVDLNDGWEGLEPTDGLLVLTQAGDRVIARPSGTEPKLKCYIEIILPVPANQEVPWEAARKRLDAIKVEFAEIIGM